MIEKLSTLCASILRESNDSCPLPVVLWSEEPALEQIKHTIKETTSEKSLPQRGMWWHGCLTLLSMHAKSAKRMLPRIFQHLQKLRPSPFTD
jgi:hypothetical protein